MGVSSGIATDKGVLTRWVMSVRGVYVRQSSDGCISGAR